MKVTLDDFGLTMDTNEAIISWTRKKKVDLVSLLANSPFTNEAIQMYKNEKKRKYQLGLHFNLVEGKPLSSMDKVPSLVNTQGRFYPLPQFIARLFFGMIRKEDIMRELQNQYAILVDNNITCTHINSHQNIHLFHFIYVCVEEFAHTHNITYIRQIATVKRRLKKFPMKYFAFRFLYFISSVLFPSYTYKKTTFFENTYHPGTTYD